MTTNEDGILDDLIAKPDHADRGHSPLGASGAERWMECPGSVALLKHLDMDESDEPDYRREGTAMHEAAAHCLDNHLDTWEIVGQTFNETVIDVTMASAVQVYLDHCRQISEGADAVYVEYGLSSPVHPLMYGTMDFGALRSEGVGGRLYVRDLKGGEGIIVEPEDNPQLKYYGFLLIDQHPEWPDNMEVSLGIVQPRAFHQSGPIRDWWTTVGAIRAWVYATLVPAMNATEYDDLLEPGPWCRFCPAKLVCPMLTSLARAAATANPKEVATVSDESLGRSYQYVQAVKFYLKALEEEVFKRLSRGKVCEGTKLKLKKANRVYAPTVTVGAIEVATDVVILQRFGDDAFEPQKLKSPAELEKLSAAARAFVKEHAYMPQTGYTVALASDPAPGVTIRPPVEEFAHLLLDKGQSPG